MNITPINSNTYHTQKNKILPNFKRSFTASKVGNLNIKTTSYMQNIMRALSDIEEKLSQITLEGRNIILANFHDVDIKDSFTFLNCGEEKYPIIISRASDFHEYRGLTKIITRKGSGNWTRKELKNSFLIENENVVLKDSDPNNPLHFTKERTCITQEEIDNGEYDEKLNKIFSDLDEPILKLRRYLLQNMGNYLRIPDGKIPYSTLHKFKEINSIFSELTEIYRGFYHKKELELKHSYPNLVIATGQKYPSFRNIGEENLTISFTPVVSAKYENLFRLQVLDSNGKIKELFTVKGDKFIKNIQKDNISNIPDVPIFVDEKEICEENYLPNFKKYLDLYYAELTKYRSYVKDFEENYKSIADYGNFSEESSVKLDEIRTIYIKLKSDLNKLSPNTALAIKNDFETYKQTTSKHGITLVDKNSNKEIFYLPLKIHNNEDLARIIIKDIETNEVKSYLIHKNKYVVKNYNPSYSSLPKVFTYMTQEEIEKTEIESYLGFLKEQLIELDTNVITRKRNKKTPSEKPKTQTKRPVYNSAQKALSQECVAMLKESLLRDLKYGMTNVDVTLKNIRKKVAEYLNTPRITE